VFGWGIPGYMQVSTEGGKARRASDGGRQGDVERQLSDRVQGGRVGIQRRIWRKAWATEVYRPVRKGDQRCRAEVEGDAGRFRGGLKGQDGLERPLELRLAEQGDLGRRQLLTGDPERERSRGGLLPPGLAGAQDEAIRAEEPLGP
jgi:hypothetical protein